MGIRTCGIGMRSWLGFNRLNRKIVHFFFSFVLLGAACFMAKTECLSECQVLYAVRLLLFRSG